MPTCRVFLTDFMFVILSKSLYFMQVLHKTEKAVLRLFKTSEFYMYRMSTNIVLYKP
jgi:hypothetical protein